MAIAMYRAAVASTNDRPVIHDLDYNYYWLYDDASTNRSTVEPYLSWNDAVRPAPGYVRATGSFVVRMAHGEEAWYTARFTSTCTSGPSCPSVVDPLEILVTRHGDFWGYSRGSAEPGCWSHAAGPTRWIARDFRLGAGWWRTAGYYEPIDRAGNRAQITSLYVTTQGALVREVDTINVAKLLFTGSSYHIGRATHPKEAPHDYWVVETHPSGIPKSPAVRVCH